jgi:hypothetical protein
MHSPAIVYDTNGAVLVADVVLDETRNRVWVLCPTLPAPKLKVFHGATGDALPCIQVSSKGGKCPSAVMAYSFEGTSLPSFVQINGQDICLAERLDGVREFFSTPRPILITTLFKDDVHNMDTFINYYTKKEASGFLLYDNNPEKTSLTTTIHWPLPYWTCPDTAVHLAQSTQITHAALLCHIFSPHTWLFNFDFDEYVVLPMTLLQLCDLAKTGGCDVVGLRSVWADAEDGVLAMSTHQQIKKSPFYFQWPQRSKYGQLHTSRQSLHRGIHSPIWCDRQVILDPHEGHILHFAYASGATRNENLVFV